MPSCNEEKMLKLYRPDGTLIERWEDWTRPKRTHHWKAGRSAMELAKAFFRDEKLSVPMEIVTLLESVSLTKGVKLTRGVPEQVTPLPEHGEGRNHDLAVVGETIADKITVCVEAKADEAFGNETIAQYWNRSMQRRDCGNPTRAPERLQALLTMVGEGGEAPTESPWGPVRYQLLTAICGTALQAKRDASSLAVLVVHEFRTELTRPEKLARNDTDFQTFLSVLSPSATTFESGNLYGPFAICGVDCLVGKAVAKPTEAITTTLAHI